jgi:hypothetical protein
MKVRLAIATLLFMIIQSVFFGIGAVLVLATPLKEQAMLLMPLVVVVTMVVAAPASWWLAPHLRARYWHHPERHTTADKVISALS